MTRTNTVLRILDVLVLVFLGISIFYFLDAGAFLFGGGANYADVYPLTTIASLIISLSLYGITKTRGKTLTFTAYLLFFQLPIALTVGEFSLSLLWIFAVTMPGVVLLGAYLNHKRTGKWLGEITGLEEAE